MTSTETPDVTLLQRIIARDASAVGELYDRHCNLLFGVIMRILRNRPDAEEVLQEVFVRVWTRADTYDERLGVPGAWLTRMARNRAIDRLRAKRTRGEVDVPDVAETPRQDDQMSPLHLAPDRLAQDKELAGHVRAALDRLPGDQRTLILAAFFEGDTHAELATRFNLPLGTVKTRIRTGMLAMRGHLAASIH